MIVSKPEAVAALYRVIRDKEPNPVDVGLIRLALDRLPGNPFPANLK